MTNERAQPRSERGGKQAKQGTIGKRRRRRKVTVDRAADQWKLTQQRKTGDTRKRSNAEEKSPCHSHRHSFPGKSCHRKKRSFVSFQGQIFLGPWCQSASKRVYHWPFRHIHRRDPRVSKRLDVCMCTRTRTLSVSGGPACQPIQPTSTSLHEKEMSFCWLKASCSACEGPAGVRAVRVWWCTHLLFQFSCARGAWCLGWAAHLLLDCAYPYL